jgi:putative nucleotidyltransferase with HDIG domain
MTQPNISRETITETLLKALDLRDRGSAAHCQRVAMLSLTLGRGLGLSEAELFQLRPGALLHDIGKIGVPDNILLKPGALTDEERSIMIQHPAYGAELLRNIPELQDIIPIVLFHHERWDGTGYPNQLAGEKIPFLARICGVTEVVDSLLSDQVYRAGWPKTRALQVMENESGKAFDPAVIKVLLKVVDGF